MTLGRSMPSPSLLHYLLYHLHYTCPFLTTPLALPSVPTCPSVALYHPPLQHYITRPSITTLLAPLSLLYPPLHHYATRSYITAKPAPSSLHYPPLRHHHPLLYRCTTCPSITLLPTHKLLHHQHHPPLNHCLTHHPITNQPPLNC